MTTLLNDEVSKLNAQTSAVMGGGQTIATEQNASQDGAERSTSLLGGTSDGGAGATKNLVQDVAYWLEALKGQALPAVCEKLSLDIKGILESGARVVKAAAMAGQLRDQALQYTKALQEINTLKEGASLSVAAQNQNAQNTNTAA